MIEHPPALGLGGPGAEVGRAGAAGAGDDRVEAAGAEVILAAAALRAAGCVWAEEEAALLVASAHSPTELGTWVARRVNGEPLEHVIGWAQLAGVRIAVAPGVFVPRQRSEHLVDVAARLLAAPPGARPGARVDGAARVACAPVVLDLCAGSGALGLAVHHRAGPFTLVAADVDPVAVACAAENLAPVGGIAFVGDLFEPVPAGLRGHIDLILANAPYVPTSALALLPHEARDHEPRLALDGGPDGLTVHRRILSEAPGWLAPGGAVLFELADSQVDAALAILAAAGLDASTYPATDDPQTVVVAGTARPPGR